MKRAVLLMALAVLVLGLADQASAQESTINVTVGWGTVSVSCGPDWNIGNVAFGSTSGPHSVTCTNSGTLTANYSVAGANSPGGWQIGSPSAPDVFQVTIVGEDIATATALTTSALPAASGIAGNATATFDFEYTAATSDTTTVTDQSFAITISASAQ